MEYSSTEEAGGISEATRKRLALVHGKMADPFSVGEAAALLELDLPKARRLLAHLAAQGWLARVRRDLYRTVPPQAAATVEWREDP